MFPTSCEAMFLSNDVALNSKNQQQLPPSFLFPFSPSIVNDVEFFHQYHHHQELLPNSSQQQQQEPLTIDTSSDTKAESDQTYNNMEASGLVINTTTSTMITTNNIKNKNKNKNKKKELSSIINDSSSGGRGSGSTKYSTNSSSYSMKSTAIRKRSAKKDRHSKIVTAQGPRDRRMRLSLDIARRFFALQDMLGFDKASKTVEWLLNNSRSAIKEFATGKGSSSHSKNNNISCSAKSGSSYTSECEVASGIDTISNDEDHHEHQLQHHHQEQEIMKCSEGTNIRKDKRTRQARKATFHHFGRESRAKARARARERNIKRIMTRLSQQQYCPDSSNLHSLNPFERVEESGAHNSYDLKSNSLEMVAHEVEKPPSSSQSLNNIISESLLNSTLRLAVSGSSIFSYQEEIGRLLSPRSRSSFPVFDENWEIQNPRMESSISYCTSNNRHHQSAGEVLENCIPSSFPLPIIYETRSQSQFTDTSGFCSKINWETGNNRSLS